MVAKISRFLRDDVVSLARGCVAIVAEAAPKGHRQDAYPGSGQRNGPSPGELGPKFRGAGREETDTISDVVS